MEIIKNENLGCELQVIKTESEIWFKAKTVCDVLGYKNAPQALNDNVREKYQKRLGEVNHIPQICLKGNAKNQIFINEPGLYSLIMKSKMPQAEAFQDWIYEDVLPSLRRTGKYDMRTKVTNSIDEDIENLENMFQICSDMNLSVYDNERVMNYINKRYEDDDTELYDNLVKLRDDLENLPLTKNTKK